MTWRRCCSEARTPPDFVGAVEAVLGLSPRSPPRDAGDGLDDLFVEFSPVVPERLDLTLELGLVLAISALLGAELFELLVALLEWRGLGEPAGRHVAGAGRGVWADASGTAGPSRETATSRSS